MVTDAADVLIHVKEPYNRNTLWVHPHDGIVEVKIFNKGWQVIASTEDKGLSNESDKQVRNLINRTVNEILFKFRNIYSKQKTDSATLREKCKNLESRVSELENKVDKLIKRYATLRTKSVVNNG